MSYPHQDWKPIIIKPANTKKIKVKPETLKTNQTKADAGKNIQHATANPNKIENKIEEGNLKIPRVTHSLRLQIQQARVQKGISQKQLAQACNMTEASIKNYENGTAIPNSQELEKMGKALGTTFKKQ
jgi:putative transcription factor